MLLDLVVQRFLDVDALGDRLDDEIAVGKLFRVVIEIRRVQEFDQAVVGQRGRLQLCQATDRALDQVVAPAFLRGQVEQAHRNAGGGQMRSDLRAHDTGAQNGGLSDDESVVGHGFGVSCRLCEKSFDHEGH